MKNKALFLGLISTIFFSVTFILNRLMSVSGNSWMWSTSLRFLFMIPLLLLFVGLQKQLKDLFLQMKSQFLQWMLWSSIGFGVFYACLCFASKYSASWLVAGTWQTTLVFGMLLGPVLSKSSFKSLSRKILLYSLLILLGVFILQLNEAKQISINEIIMGSFPVLVAAIAYPLGNRKMMQICQGKLNPFQRTLGMSLASLPVWLIISTIAYTKVGFPNQDQLVQSFIIAVFAGIVATVLFFKATDLVKDNPEDLASVEATQSGELVFTLLGEVLILGIALPNLLGFVGLSLIVLGMTLHSKAS